MANGLEFNGVTAEKLYTDLVSKGIGTVDASIMVSGWIFESLGKAKRTFSYQQDFPGVAPACVANFNRTFLHQDWLDGESVVQAQQSAGEDGFNVRFHRIETDLDAIRADLVRAFNCLAEMRSSMRNLLDEIRAELNRLNNDVYTCCNKSDAVQTATIGPFLQNPTFVGTTKFSGKDVSLWQTAQGTFVLPVPQTLGIDPVTDDRVRRVQSLGRLLQENRNIRETFPGEVAKRDLVTRFGGVTTPQGDLMRDLIAIIPDTAKFPSLDALFEEVADREAAALRTTNGADATVAATFGLDAAVQRVETASVDRMQGIPADARAVLSRMGVTVGKLAATKADDLAKTLVTQGLTGYSAGDVAEWTAQAKVLGKVR